MDDYRPGKYVIKCVKVGGDTLAIYNFTANQDQEIDLLDPATPDNIRAGGYHTAENMCCDLGFELAQKIAAGHWTVVVKEEPMFLDDVKANNTVY